MGDLPLASSTPPSNNANTGKKMKTIWPKIALLVLCCVAVSFELWHFRSSPKSASTPNVQKHKPDFALLPALEASSFARFFTGPKAEVGSWEPTLGDMNDVETNLSQIAEMGKRDPDPNRHIDNPADYYRQYGAVVVDGRKSLVLNAFCSPQDEWRKHLIVALDGGRCYWQALFDISTQKFIKLSVNGVG